MLRISPVSVGNCLIETHQMKYELMETRCGGQTCQAAQHQCGRGVHCWKPAQYKVTGGCWSVRARLAAVTES